MVLNISQDQKEQLKNIIIKEALITKEQKKIPTIDIEYEWVFDFRKIFLKSEYLDLMAETFWNIFEDQYPFQVGGLELAAVPFLSAIVLKGHQRRKPITGFIVKKSRKAYGLQQLIEGSLTEEKIILVDDLINTRDTFLKQRKILNTFHKKIDYFFTFIDFKEKENTQILDQEGTKLISIFNLADFDLKLWNETNEITEGFTPVWKFTSPNPTYFHVLPKSTPCLDEEKIYFGSDAGIFWAINQNDGSIAWQFEVGYPHAGKSILSSPCLDENYVYFGAYDGNFYALNKNTGKLKWKFIEADAVGSSPAISTSLNLIFIGLEFGLRNKKNGSGSLVAINKATGEKTWEYKIDSFVHSSPAFCPEKEVTVVGDNEGYVYLLDAKSGKLKWRYKTNGAIKASFAFNIKTNAVLFGSFDQNLYILDIDSGELKGKFMLKDLIFSTPKVHNDQVYISSIDKHLYSINLITGDLNWKFPTLGRIFCSPEIIEDKAYIGSNDGRLYEIDPLTGKTISFFQATERITNKIRYNPLTKRYFLLTYANELYCLKKDAS